MCGCAKPSEEDDAALGKLQGTVEQKHNLRRAQAARNMKQQWKRYVSDSKLRWCNLQMKWNTPHHIDEAFAATLGVKKLKDLLMQLDCTMLGGASTLVESCIEKKDLEKELVRYVQSLHEEKPAVLLGLLQRHQMDAKNCVEKQDIIRCVLWATVFSESSTGWVRTLRSRGGQRGVELDFIAATKWSLDVSQCRDGVIERIQEIKDQPFRTKVHWFRMHIAKHVRTPWSDGHIRVRVRRSQILFDAFSEFQRFTKGDLKKPFVYEFVGEPAIDAGGVAREFFQVLSNEIFNVNFGLFKYSNKNQICYTVNPASGIANSLHLAYFRFVGRIFGKALLEQHIISGHFTVPIYKHMLAYPIDLPDLDFVDEEVARNLRSVLELSNDEVEALGLDFTVTEEIFGEVRCVPLCEDGDGREVDGTNRTEYVQLMLKQLVLNNSKAQLGNFLAGFYEVIPEHLLTAFDFQELELLLGGLPVIDVEDWKNNTVYTGKFSPEHEVVAWFWEVVQSMSQVQKARLLQFGTGTASVPVIGFAGLVSNKGTVSRFTLKGVAHNKSPYPTAHTCFNRIDLPVYASKEALQTHLIATIEAPVTGFGLE